jgi:phenylalanyl-tRNA synthetase beta subunit
MAYRFSYRAADRTLKAEEVDAAHQNVLNTLVNQLSLSFR